MTGHKVERALDALTVQSLFHGPLLLTAQSQEQQFRTFSFFTILDALRQRAPFPASVQRPLGSRALRNRQNRTGSRLDHFRVLNAPVRVCLGGGSMAATPVAYRGEWFLCWAGSGA
ncbi:hypothetical protein [Streptomyces luteogriseus]|uniref:hypothetical protein n=1 Tax=Streptomyces luteogriseus TaxID=68233 RepID=UPI0037956EB3